MGIKARLLSLILLVVFLSGCVSSGQNSQISGTPTNSSTTSSPSSTIPSTTSTIAPTLLKLSDIKSVLLTGEDIPENYTINQLQTGTVDDALQYSGGDAENAREIEKNGWSGNEAIQFEYKTDNITSKSIWISISVYNNITDYFPCAIQWHKEDYNGTFVNDIGSLAYVTTDTDSTFGLTTYQIGSYYSNAYINVILKGFGRSVSRTEAITYATKMYDRLKEKCPACQQAPPVCSRARNQEGAFAQSASFNKADFKATLDAAYCGSYGASKVSSITSTNDTIYIEQTGDVSAYSDSSQSEFDCLLKKASAAWAYLNKTGVAPNYIQFKDIFTCSGCKIVGKTTDYCTTTDTNCVNSVVYTTNLSYVNFRKMSDLELGYGDWISIVSLSK
jgi:hypothetical protein